MGFVTVYIIVCLNVLVRGTCTQLPITDNTQAQDNGAVVNMTGCLGLEGMTTAKQYWEKHLELHKQFQYGGWACQIGNKAPPEKGKA